MSQPTASFRHSDSTSARLWKTQDVATYLGMSARQVRNLVDAGTIRAVRIDHHLRFDRCDVDRLIEQSVMTNQAAEVERPAHSRHGRSSTDVSLLTPISS